MSDDTTLGSARRAPPPVPVRGDLVGDYVVLDRLGEGASGVVMSAYDAALDRKLAIKLLSAEREGLLDEAQALARLAHPNVITVYDVGAVDDRVYIAMQHVDGVDLATWVARDTPGRDRILAAYAGVGRGLAAAHAAGIVHRDVKPENAIMGRDGRARLIDFGLVHATRAGAGTPRYMAPEQRRGEQADARSDQYSFCVALYEALTGDVPADDGAARGGLPAWLHRALRRGLDPDPDRRWPAIEPLVEELSRDRTALRRRAAVGVGFAALASATVWLALSGDESAAPTCPDPSAPVAAAWRPEVRERVASGFRERGGDAELAARAVADLDDYLAAWTDMRGAACVASRIDGVETEALHLLRDACLDDRLRTARALIDVLGSEPVDAARAVQAVSALPPLSACANPAWLRARVKPPEAPAAIAATVTVRDGIARSRALFWAGLFPAARKEARRAYDRAASTDYLPVRAEAAVQLGFMLGWTGASDTAADHLREGVRLALRARAYEVAGNGWGSLVFVVGAQLGDAERAYEIAADAEALLAGVPGSELTVASLIGRRGAVRARHGDHAGAIDDLRRSLAIRERRLGRRHIDVGYGRYYLADALYKRGDYAGALPLANEALTLFSDLVSGRHPDTVSAAILVARCHLGLGAAARAIEILAPLEPEVGAILGDDPFVVSAEVREVLGFALEQSGRARDAHALYRKALADVESTLGRDNSRASALRARLEAATP